MADSDDDIIFLDEIKPVKESDKWKWKAPNPIVKIGAVEDILQNVRAKLQMENPPLLIDVNATQASTSTAAKKRKSMEVGIDCLSSCHGSFAVDLPETPPKASISGPELTLTLSPEEIHELTQGCLDSDNEPEMTPVKPAACNESPNDKRLQTPRRALSFSSSIRNSTSKFFGAGASSENVVNLLSQGGGLEAKSPTKSPSQKRKRLSKNSPIRFLPSHKKLGKSPSKISPIKKNIFAQSPTKVGLHEGDDFMSSNGPYYYDAFCHIMKKVSRNPHYRHLLLETELKKIEVVGTARKEFQLYVRLMNRKDKWNRCQMISYDDIAPDLAPMFDFLERENLILCDMSEETYDTLLRLLKLEELKSLCDQFKVKKKGTKDELIQSLSAMHRTQPTLAGVSPLRQSALRLLGRCVRLTVEWRLVFRRCILLFSMFHSNEDLDKLSSEQALLLLQVKLGEMVYPTSNVDIEPNAKVFCNRDQLIRFEKARELRQEMNIAIGEKNLQQVHDLAKKCVTLLSSLLESSHETLVKEKRVQSKQGKWALMKSQLLHVNLKETTKACWVLHSVLKDKSSLSPVDRMHLQERAEKVYKLKLNGLSQKDKDALLKVMDPPRHGPEAVEICARAITSHSRGLKKVYVKDTDEGKEFMSVEEIVISHYKSLGFMNGVHDEGSTISSLCLLSLWNYIYDLTVPSVASTPSVFQSPFQDKPLDWGSKGFYESRKVGIERHLSSLLSRDVKSVADELCELRSKYNHITCVINWKRLERLDIFAFLGCISIPVFVSVSRRLMQDWKSHRSGFPDLIIWSPPQKKCLFVEVKSPNDTLSTVQCMWLDFLNTVGAKAIVAHVRESGSKNVKSRPSKK